MKKLLTLTCCLLLSLAFAGCAQAGEPFKVQDVTIQEAVKMMDDQQTFVLQVERDNCPFCAAMNAYLDQTKDKHPDTIVYRLDSTNFELFREQEGDMTLISKSDDGKEFLSHFPYFLYTPTLYIIEDGKPVQAGIGYDESNNTVDVWDVDSTINWDQAAPVDVWTFIQEGQKKTPAKTDASANTQESESGKDADAKKESDQKEEDQKTEDSNTQTEEQDSSSQNPDNQEAEQQNSN